MASDYTTCRMRDLAINDLVIEPVCGALARVTKVDPGDLHTVATLVMCVGQTGATVKLPSERTMRRQWREGERR